MTPVDSRDYRFPFAVPSIRDAPADFLVPESVPDLIGGLFLPRYASEWFGHPVPPRLLLLNPSSLTIISHPKSASPTVNVPLAELMEIESGRTVLVGWIRFLFASSSATLPYNTRCQWPVDRFMGLLRALLFSPGAADPVPEERFGAPSDIKFKNARASELDAREKVRTSLFQPPTEWPRRFGWLSFRRWSPGDFLAFTDRRLLWITDRIRNRHDSYGVVSRYVRTSSVSAIVFEPTRSELVVSLSADASWRIPVRPEYEPAARSFANVQHRCGIRGTV